LLECGSEIQFFQSFKTVIPNNLIFLSIYNSPNCQQLLNYEMNVLNSTENIYLNLFKMIPVDFSNNLDKVNSNTNGLYLNDFQNYVDDLENYGFVTSYNYSNLTYLTNQNSTVTLNCYSFSNNYEQFCQRKLIFYLFTYNTQIKKYQNSVIFNLPILSQNTSNTNSSSLITTLASITWPASLKSDSSITSCQTNNGKDK
jgi:hypothetical protein